MSPNSTTPGKTAHAGRWSWCRASRSRCCSLPPRLECSSLVTRGTAGLLVCAGTPVVPGKHRLIAVETKTHPEEEAEPKERRGRVRGFADPLALLACGP